MITRNPMLPTSGAGSYEPGPRDTILNSLGILLVSDLRLEERELSMVFPEP